MNTPHALADGAAARLRSIRFDRLVTFVRLLMGVDYTINGLNWWVKMIGPYPAISDFATKPPPPDFVGAMITSGILFHLVKATELAAGLMLLANRFVPLALVISMSITVNVFVVDVFMGTKFRSYLMGTGAMFMNVFLLWAYLEHFRPLLRPRSTPDAVTPTDAPHTTLAARLDTVGKWSVGVVTALLGAAMVAWVGTMMFQYLVLGEASRF